MAPPKNEELERIFAARYELECAPRETRDQCAAHLFWLLDQAVAGTNVSRHELMQAIFPRYVEYRKARRKSEQVTIAKNLGKKP